MSDDSKLWAAVVTTIVMFIVGILMVIVGIIILPIGVATSPSSYNLETDLIFAHNGCCMFNISDCSFLNNANCDMDIVKVPVIYKAVFGASPLSNLTSEIVYKKSLEFDCASYVSNPNNNVTWNTYNYYRRTKNNYQTSVDEGQYNLTCFTGIGEGSSINAERAFSQTHEELRVAGISLMGIGALLVIGIVVVAVACYILFKVFIR